MPAQPVATGQADAGLALQPGFAIALDALHRALGVCTHGPRPHGAWIVSGDSTDDVDLMWPLHEDDSTAALTVQTLAIQKANPRLSKAQALQRAMRIVRTGRRADGSALPGWRPEWAHPAYWAPFVLIAAGD